MELIGAEEMAMRLMAENGLVGWSVQFDRAKRRAGQCRFREQVVSLSAPLTRLHDEAEVRDTVLHEIAHALVGPEHQHDARWRAVAHQVGSTGRRCVAEDTPRLPGQWVGVCPAGHMVERHRRPERVASCQECRPYFSVDHVFEWTHHGRPAAMHPNYVAELTAMRTGEPVKLLPPGVDVRITVPGRFRDVVGTVVKRGRTRYHIDTSSGVVTVPFAGVEVVAVPHLEDECW